MQLTLSRRVAVAVAALVVLAIGIVIALPSQSQPNPTFDTIPKAVFEAGVAVEADALADYISVANPDGAGIIGYIRASHAWPVIGHENDFATSEAIPVVDRDLNLIGHMVPRKGFVPVGVGFDEVPDKPVTTLQVPVDDS